MKPSIAIRKYCESDAAGLLRMWKESQAGWPAGMSTASGDSPEEFHRNLMQGVELSHFVAEDTAAGRIVGYAGFSDDPADPRFSLLPLLNVHPDWQKCGIGRLLIAAVVNEAVAHDFHWVSLGTWPGNMYAVGLYKRCGFHWVPETEIFMVNFMPLIRSTPFLKPFFEHNDWYDSYRVEKTPEPDDHRVGAMKVYHYRFEGPDRHLTVTMDRNAAAVCGIDTGSERLDLVVEDSEGLRGFPRHFTCRIRNTQAGIMEGTVRFEGRHGLTAEGSGTFRLEPGDEWLREFDVGIPGELETPPRGAKPSVAAVIRWSGNEVTLEAGLETGLPVECTFHDTDVFLRADRTVRKILNIENRLPAAVSLELAFAPDAGLSVSPGSLTVDLPARAITGVPLDLTAAAGHHMLKIAPVNRSDPDRRLPVIDREVCGTTFGGTGWAGFKHQILVRNTHFLVIIPKQTGRITIVDNRHDAGMTVWLPDAGPPFPFKPTESAAKFSCSMENGRVTVDVTSDSATFRGVTRTLRLTIGESPLIHISGGIATRDSAMVIPRIRQTVSAGFRHSETVIPTREGIISHSDSPFPFGLLDLPHDPAFYPETWCMLRYRRHIAGFLWTGSPDDIRFSEWKIATLNYHDTCIEPGQPWYMPDSYVWLGPGDELTMQNLWADFCGKTPGLRVQPLIGFDRSIVPLIVRGSRRLRLQLRNRRELPETGTLTVEGNPDAGIRSRVTAVRDLNRNRPHPVSLTLRTRSDHPVATELHTVFRANAFDVRDRVPVILFPEAGTDVQVEEIPQNGFETFRIVNGLLALDVVPAFQGVLTAFNYGGTPLLRSPFPETGILGFESPWYGGITPELRVVSHEKVAINWTATPTAVKDGRGDEWVGVRLDSGVIMDQKKNRLTAVLEYLTLPGCPVLNARLAVRNTGTAVAHPVIMLLVFPGIRGEPFEHAAFRKFGNPAVRHRSERRGVLPFENWIGFAPAGSTRRVKKPSGTAGELLPSLAVVPGNPFRNVSPLLIDAGMEGSYIYAYEARKIEPGEELSISHFLVPFAGEAAEAGGFEPLRNIGFE